MKLFTAAIAGLVLFSGSAALAQPPFLAPPPNPAAAARAEAFLTTNAKEPGVVSLPSGLQYKIVKSGAGGPSPKEGDVVKVNYEGALIDGVVFDSTFKRGKAALMPLEDLVPAWMVAIPMMHVGDEWMIYAPPSLGYGPQDYGPIPGGSVLVFRVQLLGMLSAD